MKQRTNQVHDDKPQFRTHIKEPKVQQIASVLIVMIIAALWLGLVAFSSGN
jgi:uncharacterized protein YigA (DUF484 family)